MLGQSTNRMRGGLVFGFAVAGFLGVTGVVWAFQVAGGGASGTLSDSAGPVQASSLPTAYGLSMVFQILFPWLAGAAVHAIAAVRRKPVERWVDEVVGYASWKAGCDFGFYLVQGPSVWKAFHPAGLAAYSIVYFLVYYVFGVVVIGETILTLFKSDRPPSPRTKWFRQFLSRWFYESRDVRTSNAPPSHVLIKPLLILVAATCSWPMYDVGVNISDRSDSSIFAVYSNYNYYLLWVFTLGGYFGRIVFFNCGWLLCHLVRRLSADKPARFQPARPATKHTVSRAIRAWLAGRGVNGEFLVERAVGVVGVAFLLPMLAAILIHLGPKALADPEASRIPVAHGVLPHEAVARPQGGELVGNDGATAPDPAPGGVAFAIERPISGADTGLVWLTINGPDVIHYTTDGSVPSLVANGKGNSTRTCKPGERMLFREACIVRAGVAGQNGVQNIRSIAVLPNRWEVRLPKLPTRAHEITEVYVTGDFRGWSEAPERHYRLLPDRNGGVARTILVDASVRSHYKFLLRYGDQKPEWYASEDLPTVFDGEFTNNVVCDLVRLKPFLRGEKDGLLEEACLRWEQFQMDDQRTRVALNLLKGDVENVELRFPGQAPVPLSAADFTELGLNFTTYHAVVEPCKFHEPSVYCFHIVDGAGHWLVGPRGATPCGSTPEEQDAALRRLAAEDNLFVTQRCRNAEELADYRRNVIYFAVVDRFADGDESNNTNENAELYDRRRRDLNLYQGGDVKGLASNLDYLESMGIGSLWITPIVRNLPVLETKYLPHKAPYHGYWGMDFFEIDTRFGTWDDWNALTGELQRRRIELMLDFVPNHSSPLYIPDGGRLLRHGKVIVPSHAEDARRDRDEQFYHHHGDMELNEEKDRVPDRHIRDSYSLSDFAHGRPQVDQYLIDAGKFWIDQGATSLRLDSLKHCDPEFIRRFCKTLLEYRRQQFGRNADLYIVGEWFSGGVFNRAALDFVNHTDHCELLDFSLRDMLMHVMSGKSFQRFDQFLAARHEAFRGRDSWQVTFLDNHDTKRAYLELRHRESGHGMEERLAQSRLDQGMVLLLTLPGIPVVYYGTEIYLIDDTEVWKGSGAQVGDEPYNRPNMPTDFRTRASKGRSMIRFIRALAELRRSSLAVQRAPYSGVWSDPQGLVFQRVYEAPSDETEKRTPQEVLVVAANQGPKREIDVTGLNLPDGTYWNLLPDAQVSITVSKGAARLPLPAEGTLVFHTPIKAADGKAESAKPSVP